MICHRWRQACKACNLGFSCPEFAFAFKLDSKASRHIAPLFFLRTVSALVRAICDSLLFVPSLVGWNIGMLFFSVFSPFFSQLLLKFVRSRSSIPQVCPVARPAHRGHLWSHRHARHSVTSPLALIVKPFVTSSFLLLVARQGAPSSVLAPSSDALCS